MSSPLLSVIVPVYNTAPWLRRCLDSICAQSCRNLEILCVNDGSTDNSAEILAEYAARDERIRVFTQANAGLSAARNTALEHATGEWVTGVDSDDYLAPGVYERAVACVSPGVDMVFYGVQDVAEDGTPLPHNAYFDLPEAGEYAMTPGLAERLNVCFWSKLWRRSLLEEHRLRFPHGLVHEDYAMFYLAVPYVHRVATCPETGYYYVQRAGSIMHAGQRERETTLRYMKVLRFVHARYGETGISPVGAPWYPLAVSNVFVDRYYSEMPEMREGLQELFCGMLREQKLLPCLQRYFRFRRMVPVRGWRRWFVRRNMGQEILCFLGVPVRVRSYNDRECVASQWILGGIIRHRLQRLFTQLWR